MKDKNKVTKRIFNIVLIIVVALLYLLNNLVLKKETSGIIQYFFICYFNDMIAPVFILSYTNAMLSLVNKELRAFKDILLFCALLGFIWEFLAPIIKESSITDFIDIIFYIVGGILYWVMMKLTNKII